MIYVWPIFIEFFFGDVPFTSHIVPQRACRKAAVVVRDWPTDILDWESPTSEQVQTHSEQRDQDSKSAYLQFINSYRITNAEREFEFLIMVDWAEATGNFLLLIASCIVTSTSHWMCDTSRKASSLKRPMWQFQVELKQIMNV